VWGSNRESTQTKAPPETARHLHLLTPYLHDTVWFELEDVFQEGNDNIMAHFWSLDTVGALTKISFLPISKADEPLKYADYNARDKPAYLEKVDFQAFSQDFVNKKLVFIQQKILSGREFPEMSLSYTVKHFISFMFPDQIEEKIYALFDSLLINNCVLKSWAILTSKIKMCTSVTALQQFIKDLEKITIKTLTDIAKKNNVQLQEHWSQKITKEEEMTKELEKCKQTFISTLANKQKQLNQTAIPEEIAQTVEQSLSSTFFK